MQGEAANMFTTLFTKTKESSQAHKEGQLYRIIEAHGRTFELYYGYYEECDRAAGLEPMPIYPDLSASPVYTHHGLPFVTKMQDACPLYRGRAGGECECADCEYFSHIEELLGVCTCPENRKLKSEETK